MCLKMLVGAKADFTMRDKVPDKTCGGISLDITMTSFARIRVAVTLQDGVSVLGVAIMNADRECCLEILNCSGGGSPDEVWVILWYLEVPLA